MNTQAIGSSIAVHRVLRREPLRFRIRLFDILIVAGSLSVAAAGFYAREITRLLTGW